MCVSTLLLRLSAFNQSVSAAPPDAVWQGQSISYDGKLFTGPTKSNANDSHQIQVDSQMFIFKDSANNKAYFIYFAPGIDPTSASNANYASYDFRPPNTFSNPSSVTVIAITPSTQASNINYSNSGQSCVQTGIGWIICPVTNFLAQGMDWLFNILSTLLIVRPISTDTESPLYRAWSVMRGFANLAFVVSFLVVIYSQLVGGGITNYGIKKLLPRLVLAAIMVNISYWICAVLVDISNIVGSSIQDVFLLIRNQLIGNNGNSWQVISWSSLATAILSGGALGVGAFAAVSTAITLTAGALGPAIYLLFPVLVIVVISIITALIILAARQAIIIVLIVLSPLAFVAFILPNTEKLFEKWRKLFTTMLVLFPVFAIIFGGSQLAGTLIIQSANSIVMVIFGMMVQIAPVVITPLLVKFSGSLGQKISGIMNNPKNKIVGATRNFSKDRADIAKSKSLGNPANRRIRDASRRWGQSKHIKENVRQQNKKRYEAQAERHVFEDSRHQSATHNLTRSEMERDTVKSNVDADFNVLRTSEQRTRVIDTNLRVAKLKEEVTGESANVQWENLRADNTNNPRNITPAGLATQALEAQRLTQDAQVHARQTFAAQQEQKSVFAEDLQSNTALRVRTGGIAEHGADTALAAAITVEREAFGKAVAEADQIRKHFNLSGAERQIHAMGGTATKIDGNGHSYTFDGITNPYTVDAAIEEQLKTGTYRQRLEIIQASGSPALAGHTTTVSGAMAANGLGSMAFFLGGETIDLAAQGRIQTQADMDREILRSIAKGKISTETLATTDADALADILRVIRNRTAIIGAGGVEPALQASLNGSITELKSHASKILDPVGHPELDKIIKDNAKPAMNDIRNLP